MRLGRSVRLFAALAAASSGLPRASAGSRPALDGGVLQIDGRRFVVRGVAYSHIPVGEAPGRAISQRSCLYARDIPLIPAMGANTLRTLAPIPEDDSAFLALLESSGLYWLADFPLEPFYDPARSIASKKDQILESFRKYASAFRGRKRLIAYVFGDGVAEGYSHKFSGPTDEFYALLPAAAAILRELEPEDPPLLTTAVDDEREMTRSVEGLSFWSWNSYPGISFSGQLADARLRATKPVLISEYGIDAFDRLAGAEDEQAQADAAAALTTEIEASDTSLGGVYARFVDEWWRAGSAANRHSGGGPSAPGFPDGWRDEAWFGIFRAVPTEQHGFDGLEPRLVYRTLAALWGGRTPASWDDDSYPRLEALVHAASGEAVVSPGALVRVTGGGLASEVVPAASAAWPATAGLACLCLGDRPAPIGFVTGEEWLAQVPLDAPLGEASATIFNAGRAGNFVRASIQKYAPAVFPGGVVRAGTDCRATQQNGVRPGEVVEVYATGLGAKPLSDQLEALINHTPAEVLYAGLLPAFVGLNQVNLRVSPSTPPSAEAGLELRMEEIAGKPYPISVADPAARASITLSYSGEQAVLQAGGAGSTVAVEAEGTNGYCGPVLFQTAGLPAGLTIQAPVAFTGRAVPLEVRAGADASPVQDGSFVLIGHAGGVASGRLPIRFAVLPSRGEIRVRVVSGGFKAQPVARFDWNGQTLFATAGGGPGRGINVLSVDPATGVYSAARSFDTWGDEAASAALIAYLAGLPDGAIVLFAVADDGSYSLTTAAREGIAALFGSRFIGTLDYQQSWAMIGRKNRAAPIAEGVSGESQVALEEVLRLPEPSR